MGKRKKKGRNQNRAEPVYRRTFQEGDMVWLANEYQRRAAVEPSLTLEEFAIQYAVSADELRMYNSEMAMEGDYYVSVWHGTTRARAEAIMEEGFKPKKAMKSRIFFTQSPSLARSYANNRARNEKDHPAVIKCSINLGDYNDYEVRQLKGAVVFAFKAECIDSVVVSKVIGRAKQDRQRPEKPQKRRENRDEQLTDVAITFNSRRAGIAYWLNCYLKLDGDGEIQADHEAVAKIKGWLDSEAENGRFGAVPDDEMLEQVNEHLPHYAA
jgi:hypothetical protein